MELIIIAGMPASGKTTLAETISQEFQFPILEKDAIKEELFDTIGFTCYAEKRRHDVAANAVLLRCAEALMKSGTSTILVNNFRADMQEGLQVLLDKYACNAVLLFLGGDADVFYQRYVERDRLHLRHLGHVLQDRYPPAENDSLDYTMTREEFAEKFEKLGMDEMKLRLRRIDIDATYPEKIDVSWVIEEIKKIFCEESS